LDSKEIAWILDKKENNIRVLVHRALNTLKKEISAKDSECLAKK
jgi:DNA-directed RNA polymerase specialized sigma24 family protein